VAHNPKIVVLSGPNGAGKSTAATSILPPDLTFLNADEVAKILPGYPSTRADLQAGRRILEIMNALERERADFAVETTLASRTLAHRLKRMKLAGYLVRLIYVTVQSPFGTKCALRRSGKIGILGYLTNCFM
jgi:predicted ABC-type ATPase